MHFAWTILKKGKRENLRETRIFFCILIDKDSSFTSIVDSHGKMEEREREGEKRRVLFREESQNWKLFYNNQQQIFVFFFEFCFRKLSQSFVNITVGKINSFSYVSFLILQVFCLLLIVFNITIIKVSIFNMMKQILW